MIGFLKTQLLRSAASSLKDYACPKCGHKFAPFAGGPPASFREKVVCPACGDAREIRDAMTARADLQVNPPGPFSKPPASKIEKKTMSSSETLFYIPASGTWGGWLLFALFWNAISWSLVYAFLFKRGTAMPWAALGFIVIFPLIGIGLVYAAVRAKFASHLLYLNPERIRLQRELFGRRKNFDIVPEEIEHVKKTEFYQRNYKPIYGIEIKAGRRRIRFGSVLSDDEKNWMCSEIREFLNKRKMR